jgi:hypothetical protein
VVALAAVSVTQVRRTPSSGDITGIINLLAQIGKCEALAIGRALFNRHPLTSHGLLLGVSSISNLCSRYFALQPWRVQSLSLSPRLT